MTTLPSALTRAAFAALMCVVAFAACERSGGRRATRDSAAMPHADGMAGMPGMGGMGGMGSTMGIAMTDSMHAHMRTMGDMSGDRMKAILPIHRQMAANMLSRMNSEMRNMNMQADGAWNATVDSLRQDLIRMPEMGARELEAMMPAHHARMTCLMQMHRDMMGRMAP